MNTQLDPRPHYYNFTHLALPELFVRDADKLMRSLATNGSGFLNYLWDSVSRYESTTITVDEDIKVEMVEKGNLKIALIHLPAPERPTEAWFAAPVFDPIAGISRYFTLELGVTSQGDLTAYLGEWRDMQHLNWGEVSGQSKIAFLKAINAQLAREIGKESKGK
jgi:hypothetical protein